MNKKNEKKALAQEGILINNYLLIYFNNLINNYLLIRMI